MGRGARVIQEGLSMTVMPSPTLSHVQVCPRGAQLHPGRPYIESALGSLHETASLYMRRSAASAAAQAATEAPHSRRLSKTGFVRRRTFKICLPGVTLTGDVYKPCLA